MNKEANPFPIEIVLDLHDVLLKVLRSFVWQQKVGILMLRHPTNLHWIEEIRSIENGFPRKQAKDTFYSEVHHYFAPRALLPFPRNV